MKLNIKKVCIKKKIIETKYILGLVLKLQNIILLIIDTITFNYLGHTQ